jgi:hypothetical protein
MFQVLNVMQWQHAAHNILNIDASAVNAKA